jgi:hypothetical protein
MFLIYVTLVWEAKNEKEKEECPRKQRKKKKKE